MVVRELITRLGFSVDNAGMDRAEKGIARVKTQAESAAVSIRNLAAAWLSFASVKGLIGIADNMQNIRSRIGQLPQTVGEVGDAFDEVAKHATASGMKIDAYASLYTRTGNAAKDYVKTQEDLLGITDTISKALVVGGASAQEASAVMIQFSQALGSGVLQGDEFRSMAEAAPQYLDQLSLAMNIPRENLKKMASEGKLTSRAVIEATRKMADHFNEKFKAMPMTVGRAMTVVYNRFATAIDKLNRKTNFIGTIANAIVKAFDYIEEGVTKLIDKFDGLENMLRFVGVAIGVAFGAKAIAIMRSFSVASLLAALPMVAIAAAVALVAVALEDLYVWINGGDSVIGSLIGPWAEWRPYVMAAIEMVTDAFKWLGDLFAAVGAILVGAFTLDWNLFVEGVKGLALKVWDIMTALGKVIYDALFSSIVGALMDAWDSVKNFVGLGSDAGSATPTAGQMTAGGMGAARPNVSTNTTVNVTVPQGTTPEQAAMLQKTAQQAFSKQTDDRLARDLATFSA